MSIESSKSFVCSVEIQAPNPLVTDRISVFLGGSIEMGEAIQWQKELTHRLFGLGVAVFNPRRDDWDPSCVQSIDNPQFNEQVTWELKALEQADIIVFYFDPATKSPITLMELGLFAKSKKCITLCPEGFWRKGNVDIVCQRYGVEQVQSVDELIESVKRRIDIFNERSYNH